MKIRIIKITPKRDGLPVINLQLLCIFLLFLNNSPPLIGQTPELYFQHVSQEDGLVDETYNAFITKDSRGLVWLGSVDGVSCFDGVNVKIFKEDPNEPGGMLGNNIQSGFFEDVQGNLWFSTFQALNCLVRQTNSIEHYQMISSRTGEVIESDYRVFYINKKENLLWLRAGDEIFRLNTNSPGEYLSFSPLNAGMDFAVDTTQNGAIRQIYSCPWWNGKGIEQITFDSMGRTTFKEHLKNGIPEIELLPPMVSKAIPQGDIVWLLSDQGLIAFDEKAPETPKVYNLQSGGKNHFYDGILYEDRYLLLTLNESGIWLFDTEIREFVKNWRHEKDNPLSLGGNNPIKLYIDEHDFLWVSLAGKGVSYAPLFKNPFINLFDVHGIKKRDRVLSIVEDFEKNIWTATKSSGILSFDSEKELHQEFPYCIEGSDTISLNNIQHLFLSEFGEIGALGTYNLFLFDKKDHQWKRKLTLKEGRFRFIRKLSSGRIMVSTSTGLFDLKNLDGQLTLIRAGEFEEFEGAYFNQFFESTKGELYLPFDCKQMWIYSTAGDKLELISKQRINADVFSFWEDSRTGCVWMGTSKGLLKCGNKIDCNCNFYLQSKDKLGVGNVFGVLGDYENKLWLSSNRGIWAFSEQDSLLLHFRKQDGFASNNFLNYASLAASDGRIWFGNNDGLIGFYPDSIMPFPFAPQVYFNELLVNNVPFVGETFISEETRISLPYRENTLAFEITAVGNYMSGFNRLKYCLKNYDDNWVTIKNGGTARFTKIPPGIYDFQAIAVNANGVESKLKKLEIEIRPPFWLEPWFVFLGFAFAIFLAYSIFRYYVNKKLRKQKVLLEKQKALTEERNRIAGELHDDMGAGLSAIRFLSEYVLIDEKDTEKKGKLNRIYDSAGVLLQNMRDIIWALDREYDSLSNLLIHLRSYAQEYLSSNELKCNFVMPDSIPKTELSGERRRNILLIIKECLHNVVKHAEAKQVHFRIIIKNQILHLWAKDDGCGFLNDRDRKKGNGLQNMHKRARDINAEIEIESISGQGTQLKLSVPLK